MFSIKNKLSAPPSAHQTDLDKLLPPLGLGPETLGRGAAECTKIRYLR